MARPTTADITHTVNGWDTELNSWRAAIFDNPLPPVEYANFAALPSAALYDRCLATTADGLLWISDGTSWKMIAQDSQDGPSFGSFMKLTSKQEELLALSGATVDTSIQFPAGCIRLGVSARVTTLITGATTFDVGVPAGDVDLYGAAIALAASTTLTGVDHTATPLGWLAAAEAVRLTANGANFTAGAVRVVLHYLELQAPTS